jgi:hypothetical protein
MSNKRNRNTSKTLTQDQCALLMLVKTKPGRRQQFVGEVRVCSFEESEVM